MAAEADSPTDAEDAGVPVATEKITFRCERGLAERIDAAGDTRSQVIRDVLKAHLPDAEGER